MKISWKIYGITHTHISVHTLEWERWWAPVYHYQFCAHSALWIYTQVLECAVEHFTCFCCTCNFDWHHLTSLASQVHQVLGELYGHLVTTKTYTSEGQPRWKKLKRAASKQKEHMEEEGRSFDGVPCIVVRFRPKSYSDGAGAKGGTGEGDLYTRFVLRKENIVRWSETHVHDVHGVCQYICCGGSAGLSCSHATFTCIQMWGMCKGQEGGCGVTECPTI